MKNTWASGALELLKHADSHTNLDTAFDKRIAFISIDNCVEVGIRTYLSLPASKSGVNVTRKELEDSENSFPKLLSLLFQHAGNKLTGIDDADIEHYHRIRNKLYHDGTGLSVDQQYLDAYRSIAAILLQNLFGVNIDISESQKATLEVLIHNWNRLEQIVADKLDKEGIDITDTYKWETAYKKGILKPSQVSDFTELRSARNKLVHSTKIDQRDIEYWVNKSIDLLSQLKSDTQ